MARNPKSWSGLDGTLVQSRIDETPKIVWVCFERSDGTACQWTSSWLPATMPVGSQLVREHRKLMKDYSRTDTGI